MDDPIFYDHEIVQRAPSDYIEIKLKPDAVLKAWSLSMFAHEILNQNGDVKKETEMSAITLDKYLNAIESFKKNEGNIKPIIGIGIMDNIEIGVGREIVAAAKIILLDKIPIHVRKAQEKEIRELLLSV